MQNYNKISYLKEILQQEITSFCRKDRTMWKKPIVHTISELNKTNCSAVFFGGTLRSLLLSRLSTGRPGMPRDIDIVVHGVSSTDLQLQLKELITRNTRFGGLKLLNRDWRFDIWPLENTWAFCNGFNSKIDFINLTNTTFLNIEAIAIDVWPQKNKKREIYSSEDKFFTAIINKLLDINYETNPFPQLCVIRSLLFANNLDYSISTRLVHYIVENGIDISPNEFDDVQTEHYSHIKCEGNIMRSWIRDLEKSYNRNKNSYFKVNRYEQPNLWQQQVQAKSCNILNEHDKYQF